MSVQDIQFKEGETEAQRLKKLRQLVEEVLRLSKRVSSSSGGGPDVSAAEVVTVDDQTELFPNSRQLVAGTNVTLDDSTPGELEINATGGSGPDVSEATVLTDDAETTLFPNSRRVLPGTNVSFDDSTPNERTINVTGGSGVVETVVGTAGEIDVDSTDPANPVVSLGADALASLADADSAVQPGDLAAVAFSGAYGDLSGTPAIPTDIHTKTFLTETDESAVLTNSRRVLPGTNMTFDDSTPNVRTLNVTSPGSKSIAVDASWTFSTTTTAANPGSGLFRMNNATLASVTALYFNDTDLQSKDSSTIFSLMRAGHRIYVEQDDDKTRAAVFEISATPTDNTGWWTVPVTVVASATLPQNSKACWANFQFVSFNANNAPEVRGASFSGGLSAIIVPTNKVPVSIRADCRIAGWVVLTQGGTGSCVLDILKSSYGGYPPASSLCGGNKPTLSSAVKNQDTTLTSWTTTLAAGDTLLVNLESSSTFTAISIFLILVPISYTPPSGFTAQDARDAVGAILTDSNTIHWTYSGSTIVADVKVGSTGSVESGQYTPTGTAVANCSAVTPSVANYMRVGDVVTVSGYVTFTCTAGGATTTQVGLSLPIASNIGATYDCAGVGASEGTVNNNNETSIRGDATNNRAELVFASSATGSVTKWYTYTYRILP